MAHMLKCIFITLNEMLLFYVENNYDILLDESGDLTNK